MTSAQAVVQSPRRNRITPFGEIEATKHRGALMGNRGVLHANDGTLGRVWKIPFSAHTTENKYLSGPCYTPSGGLMCSNSIMSVKQASATPDAAGG
jgi:hypothetical protein